MMKIFWLSKSNFDEKNEARVPIAWCNRRNWSNLHLKEIAWWFNSWQRRENLAKENIWNACDDYICKVVDCNGCSLYWFQTCCVLKTILKNFVKLTKSNITTETQDGKLRYIFLQIVSYFLFLLLRKLCMCELYCVHKC